MSANGNGFKVAFWVMGFIAITGLTGITAGVVANEKRNVDDHVQIRKEFNGEVKEMRECMNDKFEKIMIMLTKLETKIIDER